MKYLNEPYYKKYITGELKRFDDRNTGFSRGALEGDKYTLMLKKGVENVGKMIPNRTILDHAMSFAARNPDTMFRKNVLARDAVPAFNNEYRLKNPDPIVMTKIIKDIAKWLDADLVGIAKLNPLWIYTHWGLHNVMCTGAAEPGEPIRLPPDYTNVIVTIHEMDYDLIGRSPGREAATPLGYSKIGWCTSSIATFIRELGYKAIPCGNELGLNIPMAVDAGLGEMGRHGLLITREFGPRVRIGKVFSNLPLEYDSPVDIGVQKFCEVCGLCATACPSNSISSGLRSDRAHDVSNSEGLMKWPVRAMNCFEWWVKNGNGCSVCIRVCPWNKRNNILHRVVRIFAEKGLFNKTIVLFDQLLGYGKKLKGRGYGSLQDPSVIKCQEDGRSQLH